MKTTRWLAAVGSMLAVLAVSATAASADDGPVTGGPQGSVLTPPSGGGFEACSGGVSQLVFQYEHGWERFAHWSTCGYYLDQYWTDWTWAQSDYEYWGDQNFGPVPWPQRGY